MGCACDSGSIRCVFLFCMSVTNESPKREAINFINQQSQTPAESVYGAKHNRCGTAVERRGVYGRGGTTVVIGADPYHDSVSLSHMFAFSFFFFFFSCVAAWRIAVTWMQTSPSWQTRIGGLERSTARHFFFFFVGVCLPLHSCACQQICNIIRVFYLFLFIIFYRSSGFITWWSNTAAVATFRVRAATPGEKVGWNADDMSDRRLSNALVLKHHSFREIAQWRDCAYLAQ